MIKLELDLDLESADGEDNGYRHKDLLQIPPT